ncbi:integrase catalytic domain-containing protein [Trichonephila clavipes]|nr:integrase catalytic domain-containing protein [Trichonephila clavipes]
MIRICLVCKKYSAKPADQLSGQLPRDRITQSPPFQVVGIDFTGAILVKDNQGTRKSYVSLFTCAVTRAVHLELVSDMSTKCFLLALRRFLARRVADKGIHWKFIVERAPWWGGFYERLVKTIKDPLCKILGRALLTFEELSTILSEVEAIVNHRPLTYVENDPGEPEPLTPAHFLELGYRDSKYPIHFIELIDATTAKESYKKRKTYRTLLLKQLWRRWKEQYLLQLKTANHFKTPSVHKNLKLNDVVLVEGNVKSKLLWELGIIKEIFIGRDDNENGTWRRRSHFELYQSYKVSGIVNFIKIQRIKLAGHVAAVDEDHIAEKVFNVQPIATRRKGRYENGSQSYMCRVEVLQVTQFTHGAANAEADGIQRLPHRWQRVVTAAGVYIEGS